MNISWFNFYPVGHGLFYAGIIFENDYKFVYDCGCKPKGPSLHAHINNLLSRCPDKSLDFVAISHLHYDHCSGIDYLSKVFKVKKYYLPYISKVFEIRLAVAVSLMSLNGQFDYKLAKTIVKTYRDTRVMYNQFETSKETEDGSKVVNMFTDNGIWKFVFTTKTITAVQERSFKKEYKNFIFKNGSPTIDQIMKNPKLTRGLRRVYTKTFGSSNYLNETSLTLLHYPLNPITPVPSLVSGYMSMPSFSSVTLLTGDAMLDRSMCRRINGFSQDIGYIQVPHHGSYPNWRALDTHLIRSNSFYIVPKHSRQRPNKYYLTTTALSAYTWTVVNEASQLSYFVLTY